MKKVFCLCTESLCAWFVVGKEYPVIDGKVLVEPGYECYSFNNGDITDLATFKIIEREVFTADGVEWFKHTPGNPMPCGGDTRIDILLPDGPSCLNPRIPSCVDWGSGVDGWGVIGWRFADSAKPEVPQNIACGPAVSVAHPEIKQNLKVDESARNDLTRIAVDDPGHLTPGQKAYIQAKEDAQAAKQQLKHDAEAKALQERADQLADAGKAMDVVRDGFTHKLGWLA